MHDPGWRRVAIVVVPIVGTSMLRRTELSAVEQVRALWLSFTTAVVLLAFVAVLVAHDREPDDGTLSALVALGLVSVGISITLARRPLDRSSTTAVWDSYRKRFFTTVACAEAPVLIGFVLAVADGSAWLGVIGGALALVGLSTVMPTRRRVTREGLLGPVPPTDGAS